LKRRVRHALKAGGPKCVVPAKRRCDTERGVFEWKAGSLHVQPKRATAGLRMVADSDGSAERRRT
jgi:hypothetical protein